MISLETKTKYYNIEVVKDLLDDILVVCDYGSKLTRFSHRRNIHVASMAEANLIIDKILKVREKHNYHFVGGLHEMCCLSF